MKKKVLVINANPKSKSLTELFSNEYMESVSQNHDVVSINIRDFNFEPNLNEGYSEIKTLEPDLVNFQGLIKWADHIAIFTPVWWGTIPALFKGVLDRVLLPGFAFQYEEGKSIPKKLLAGRSSELFINLDTPVFWYKYFQGNVIYKHLKNTILDFVGIKNVRATYFGPVISADDKGISKWIGKVRQLARTL